MALQPDVNQTALPRARVLGLASLVFLSVLLIFFYRSFSPSQAVFSNDGPLGANMAACARVPGGWTGFWQDLNWLGASQGSAPPSFTYGLLYLLGPLGYARFYQPLSLLCLGLCAWGFFRVIGFRPAVATLAALAAMLNSDPFSYACWGLGSHVLALAATFLALAAISAQRWPLLPRLAMGGFAVGLGVMEGFDNGAIMSLYVAAFVAAQAWWQEPTPGRRLGWGAARLALVAGTAGWVALSTIQMLVGTQIKGVVGMQQDAETKARRYVEATQWSLPPAEILRAVIPGLYGYRMDTPGGGNYWGAVGRHPVWDAYLASPSPDPSRAPDRTGLRHSGAGHYAGMLVVVLASFGFAQALRQSKSPYSPSERRWVLFWAAVAAVSLFLSLGRHAPLDLYRLTVYQLPFFSTIRNPIKFLHPFSLSVAILCGYGLETVYRRLEAMLAEKREGGLVRWWSQGPEFERRFGRIGVAVVIVSVLGLLVYGSSRTQAGLIQHLRATGFDNAGFATAMARFSLKEVAWAVLFLFLSLGGIAMVLSGFFRGPKAATAATLLLGTILVADFVRANSPWVVYYDYEAKYATNQVIEELRPNAYERRVTALLLNAGPDSLSLQQELQDLYYLDWMQHLFLYYNIPCLDIIQMSRMDQETYAFKAAMAQHPLRLWELTSTRYLLSLAAFADPLNKQFDPGRNRFRVRTPFELRTAAGGSSAIAMTNSTGPYAILEFGGALAKASLYSHWEVRTNETAVLERLAEPGFDPAQSLVLSEDPGLQPSTTNNPGKVTIASYAPKRIRLEAEALASSVLLLNDKHHPDWQVFVDGKAAPLLRCNYLMRGVAVPPGKHQVEFVFAPPVSLLWVSLAGIVTALLLCSWLVLKRGAR